MSNLCFGSRKNGCKILEVERCPENCSFFKTEEGYAFDRAQALTRLASLPARKQKHISEKYYGGTTPWRSGAAKSGPASKGGRRV